MLSDEAHAALSAEQRQQLWAAVSGAMTGPVAAPAAVRAAAARATGSLAALPSFVLSQLGSLRRTGLQGLCCNILPTLKCD